MKYPTACLFPTTTVFLDDDQDYLEALLGNITMPRLKLKPFANHDAAAKYLGMHLPKHELTNRWMKKTTSEEAFENTALEICYGHIQQEGNDEERSQRVTTLVVDYQMPLRNGLDFIRSLNQLPIKKILLTSTADLNIPIDAVNENLIDAFFKKEDEDLVRKLTKKLDDYQFDYFREQSQLIKRSLKKINGKPLVEHPSFQRLFDGTLTATNAVEYYLVDENCSYEFINQQGGKTLLHIQSKEQLECEYDEFYIPRELCCGGLFQLDEEGLFYYEIK